MKAHFENTPIAALPRIELIGAAGSLGLRHITHFDTQPEGLPYVTAGNRQILEPVTAPEQFNFRPDDN